MSYRFDAVGDTRSAKEMDFLTKLNMKIKESPFSPLETFTNFPLYVPRQNLTTFLVKYELFKRILNVHGSIIECGVGFGGGLMTWAQFSAILEPTNHTRRVIGFDTFAGFPSVSEHDTAHVGGLAIDSQAEIEACAALYDQNRAVGHIKKVEVIRGDGCLTIPAFLENHPHLVVSLLYLDFDLYAPTMKAIEVFRERMPDGAIIAFDELNLEAWPGETQAVIESLGLPGLRLERSPIGSTISWAQL